MSIADEEQCKFESHCPSCNENDRSCRNVAEDVTHSSAKYPSIEEYEAKLNTS